MNVNQRSYIIFLLVTQWRGRERLNTKVGKTVFSEDHHHGEECVSAQICTNSSSRQHIDKSFLIPQDTTKTSSVIFFFPFLSSSVYIGKMHISIKIWFSFYFFKCRYCARIIFNLTVESITVNRYKNAFNSFFFVSNNLPF